MKTKTFQRKGMSAKPTADILALAPRSDFPALDEHTYLNTASIALMPVAARTSMQDYERQILHAGTVNMDEEADRIALEGVREAAARLIHTSPDNVAITSSATEALCQIAWALRPKKNVVSIDLEFPSVVYPWLRVARETGLEVRLVRALADPASLSFGDVAQLVDSDTDVICLSHVQYATGHCFDLAALADLAHDHGALLVVDASQSVGCVPLDVEAVGVDAVVATAYKWLCGPFGSAFFYLKPELLERIEPILVGWRCSDHMWEWDATDLGYAPNMRRFEYSTLSYSAAFGFGQALDYLLRIPAEQIYSHDVALADRLIAHLDELGVEVLTPRQGPCRSGIVTARFSGRDGEGVAAELNRRGVIVSPRFGATRFSMHFYNSSDEVDTAVTVLADVLSRPESNS